jgi:2-keto-4-pentenoate hydratase/2-oxohepta-3-ene-1,7-dioic acid hydratase in catechol pathway
MHLKYEARNMKLVTFSSPHGPGRVGVLRQDRVLDVMEMQSALGKPRRPYFESMSQLITAGPEALAELSWIERKAPAKSGYSFDKVVLRAALPDPVRLRQTSLYFASIEEMAERFARIETASAPDPEKAKRKRISQMMRGFGLAYAMRYGDPEKAYREAGLYFRLHKGNPPRNLRDEMPFYWGMDTFCISQPGDEVKIPSYAAQPQFGLQIVAVIGRQGVDISTEKASDYIFGYTLLNDMTVHDRAGFSRSFSGEIGSPLPLRPGADFLGCFGLGSVLVTRDEFALQKDTCSVHVNSQTIAQRSIGTPTYTFEDAIRSFSRSMDIYPGDMIASGPLPGLASLMVDKELKRGDVIELRSSQLGMLQTRYV